MAPMEIDLRSLSEGLNLFRWEVTAADLEVDPEETGIQGPARVALTVTKTGEAALTAHGEVAFGLRLACSRCLEPIDQAVDATLSLIFQKGLPEALDDRNDLDETDLVLIEEGGTTVDVAAHVRDVILLEVPVKPLCSESCAGLCPQCGANRNHETCACRREEADPRWEALKRLKNRQ